MGCEQERGRGRLVDVADLQADDAILDVIDDADPVARGDLCRAFDQGHGRKALAVERHGHPALELDLHDLRLLGGLFGAGDELKDVVLGSVVEILDPATLGGATPQVVVDRVGDDLGAALDGDAVLARVGDLLLAAHLPRAHGRDRAQLRGERGDRGLDAHLVVALAGAAVGDRVAAARARVPHRELGDQRAPERGEQRIAAAVERVGLDRREQVLARELLARVDDVTVQRAEVQRLGADRLVVLAGLPEVDGQAHDLGVIAVLDPLEHHARIEAARVEQQHAPDLLGVGLVGGGARGKALLG